MKYLNYPKTSAMAYEKDTQQLLEKGLTQQDLEQQLELFRKGIPPVKLNRPASPGDGVVVLNQNEVVELANFFRIIAPTKDIVKFVPASGAATRMFSDLVLWHQMLASGVTNEALLERYPTAKQFFTELKAFAFWDELRDALSNKDLDAQQLLDEGHYITLLTHILFDQGQGYSQKPKGLIPFHRYHNGNRTPLEEHLVEGAYYARRGDNSVHLHFTVLPEHMNSFEKIIKKKVPALEKEFGVKFFVHLSVQNPSTDTVAVDSNNELFREKDGKMVFRPGGHGALIENLNNLDCDLVFIKNIDNVVPDHHKNETYLYKKATGGLLLKIQQEIFYWLRILTGQPQNEEAFIKAKEFAMLRLNLDPYYIKGSLEECRKQLIDFLNRPLRICGMVKNQGEPGGGPFWIKDERTGRVSLQIIESSQINMNDPAQKAIFSVASHFNPVDLVCSLKDFQGKKFNLKSFVDKNSGFISQKTKDGKLLKALELPGLWNGAMASWITLFVEVPLITFNPVKTVTDLLRPEHC